MVGGEELTSVAWGQSFSNRLRPTLVACALMASALLGSGVSHADTSRPWHVDLSAQFRNSQFDEDGNLTYAEAVGSGYASYIGRSRCWG